MFWSSLILHEKLSTFPFMPFIYTFDPKLRQFRVAQTKLGIISNIATNGLLFFKDIVLPLSYIARYVIYPDDGNFNGIFLIAMLLYCSFSSMNLAVMYLTLKHKHTFVAYLNTVLKHDCKVNGTRNTKEHPNFEFRSFAAQHSKMVNHEYSNLFKFSSNTDFIGLFASSQVSNNIVLCVVLVPLSIYLNLDSMFLIFGK